MSDEGLLEDELNQLQHAYAFLEIERDSLRARLTAMRDPRFPDEEVYVTWEMYDEVVEQAAEAWSRLAAAERVVGAARKYVALVDATNEASFEAYYEELVPAVAALTQEIT